MLYELVVVPVLNRLLFRISKNHGIKGVEKVSNKN